MFQKKEQGVALLYVLGILALLIAMALAFMNSSIFDQRAMAQNAARSLAEGLALSTMEQVIRGVQDATVVADDDDTFSVMPDAHYSISRNDTDPKNIPKDQSALAHLDTFDYVGESRVYVFDWNEFEKKDDIRWILHRVNIGGTSPSIYEVIGRTAFVLHPLGASQLDPAFLVKHDENEGSEFRRGQDISEISILAIKKPFEANSIFNGQPSFFNYTDNGSANNGELPVAGHWTNTQNLLNIFFTKYPGLSASLTEKIGIFANKFFVCEPSAAARGEKYVMNYGDPPVKHELHRFYLPRFNDKIVTAIEPSRRNGDFDSGETNFWDTLDINTTILLDPGASPQYEIGVDILTENGVKWDSSNTLTDPFNAGDYALGRGIQWLANFGYDDEGTLAAGMEGTFDNILLRRQQIAANLKDYCDSDEDVPTSDIAPDSWGLTANIPAYTGNERTPYLNEFELKLIINNTMEVMAVTSGTPSVTTYRLSSKVVVDLALGGEIINIYNITSLPDTEAKVSCELDADPVNRRLTVTADSESETVTLAQASGNPYPITISHMVESPVTNLHYAGIGSILDGSSNKAEIETAGVTLEGNLPDNVLVSLDLRVNIANALLKFDSKNVDYAKLNKAFRFHGNLSFPRPTAINTPVTVAKTYILSAQVEDPRQNLNPGDWYISPEANSTDGTNGEINITSEQDASNLGSVNDKSNPSAPSFAGTDYDSGYDREEVTSPAYIDSGHFMSTAYIRNAPMLSPWELGFIHRGKKWQTLNLSKYDRNKAVKGYENSSGRWFLPGGGRYEDGDANILDQIKMTPEAEGTVKVNLGGKSEEMLNALFANISLGCSPVANGDSIAAISRTSGSELEAAFINGVISKLNTGNFVTRAGIADILSVESRDEAGAKTKAGQEELIGKIIQLVDIYPGLQMFELIILSQAIKDIGDPNNHAAPIPVNKPFYDGSTIKTAEIRAYMGEINWEPSAGVIVDEVTAQCKLRVRGYRKPTGEVQLISIKTLE